MHLEQWTEEYVQWSNPWHKLIPIAERLGVKPYTEKRATAVVVALNGDKYDIFEMIEALLDRLDRAEEAALTGVVVSR